MASAKRRRGWLAPQAPSPFVTGSRLSLFAFGTPFQNAREVARRLG
jgi:hypothetical protein